MKTLLIAALLLLPTVAISSTTSELSCHELQDYAMTVMTARQSGVPYDKNHLPDSEILTDIVNSAYRQIVCTTRTCKMMYIDGFAYMQWKSCKDRREP